MKIARRMVGAVVLSFLVAGAVQAQQLERTVEELAIQISNSLEADNKKKVAILSLTDLGGSPTPLGMLMAEELTNQLFLLRSGRFDVVERARVEAIWEEQKLAKDGRVSPEEAGTVGKLVGADAVLSGSIAELDDRLRVNARLMAVPSGQLFATASTFMLKTSVPARMLEPAGGSERGATGAGGAIASQTVGNVTFDLLGCRQSTRLISCRLVATNNHADMKFWVNASRYSYHSVMYDQMGREFVPTAIKLLGLEGKWLEIKLISEIPTQIEVQFRGVPSSIDFVKVFELSTSAGRLEFRDIRFSN